MEEKTAETPASEIAEVVNGWQWDQEKGEWVQAAPSTPPPPAPPQPPEQVADAGAAEAAPIVPAAEETPPPPPAPPAPVDLPPPPPAEQVAAAPEPKVMDASWPFAGYAGPQPWEADNPPALTQNRLMVSSGSAGDEVVELAALLAHLGYGTTISAGQNPHAIYDTGVSEAVAAFCADYGVKEDPKVTAARTPDTVGPWLWEAITRAAHKKIAGEPGGPETVA